MRQTLGSGGSRSYAAAMAGVWLDLRRTLHELDALAAEPGRLDDDDTLPTLQYELHAAGEMLAGIEPPTDAQALHEELADALADARDVTAEIGEAKADGGADAVLPLLWEWRGSLFRVRYARLRLDRRRLPAPPATPADAPRPRTPPPVTAAVVGVGSALVLAAALLGLWLLVALTLTGTLAASLLLRP
jgi:hypothetical protein